MVVRIFVENILLGTIGCTDIVSCGLDVGTVKRIFEIELVSRYGKSDVPIAGHFHGGIVVSPERVNQGSQFTHIVDGPAGVLLPGHDLSLQFQLIVRLNPVGERIQCSIDRPQPNVRATVVEISGFAGIIGDFPTCRSLSFLMWTFVCSE